MSDVHRKRLVLAALVLSLILACQLSPQSTHQSLAPTDTSAVRLQSLSRTATHTAALTPIPTRVQPATSVPATPSPTPSPTPRLPNAGSLPAYWTELDLAMHDPVSGHSAGTYDVFDLAMHPSSSQLYALGHCTPGWGICLSILDTSIDRVVRSGTLISPSTPGEGEEGRLLLAGETLYVHQPWAGVLYALERETLSPLAVLTDVYGVAYDAAGRVTYLLTDQGLTTLQERSVVVPVERSYATAPLEMVAGAGRVYVLDEMTLQIYGRDLQRLAQVDLPEGYLTGLLLDLERNRLYIGGYAGLYVFDTETLRLRDPLVDAARSIVPNVMAMTLDQQGNRLFVVTRRDHDWYGGYAASIVDTMNWRAQELYSTQSGTLRDLAVDEGLGRLLVASAGDHSLLPVFYETLEIAPRLPMGIEVGEVIVDPARERLYVSDSAGWVTVLHRRTYEPIFRVFGGRSISLDAERGILYAGDPRVPVVTQFDAQTGQVVLTIEQAGKPRANPAAGQVVILNRRFFVHDAESGQPTGELLPGIGQPSTECPECYYTVGLEAVIDTRRGYTATLTYTPWPGKPGPQESIDYDLASGRAYHSLRTGGYVHYSSISAYADLAQFERGDPALRTLEGLSGDLALDAAVRRLYVARGNMLLVLNSETLNRQGRVYTDGWTPTVAAVDAELGRLYVPRGRALEIWSRTGAAPAEPLLPETWVLTHTVTSLVPSPDYMHDRTLLATIDGWPARSTDGGETWQRLRGGLPEFDGYRPTVALAFSPAYADDRRLFAGVALEDTHGEGVYCSEDGGDTWQMCSEGLYDLRVYRVQPSPLFAQDRAIVAYARTPHGDALYRSTDGGKTWHLELRQTETGRPPLPSLGDLFHASEYDPQIECDYGGTCRRSSDGGREWHLFDTTGVPLESMVKAQFSPQYAQDSTIYFVTYNDLLRYREQEKRWARCQAASDGQPVFGGRGYERSFSDLAVVASSEDTHELLLGSAGGEFYRIAATELTCTALDVAERPAGPRPTPSPTPCAEAADERLVGALATSKGRDAVLERLGCASGQAEETGVALQPFEGGGHDLA